MTKVVRKVPANFRPYMLFSPHTPISLTNNLSVSAINVKGNSCFYELCANQHCPRLPPDYLVSFILQRRIVVAQAASFGRTARRIVLGIKIKHHFLSTVVAQQNLLSVRSLPSTSGALSPLHSYFLYFRLNIIISPASYDSLAFVNRIVHKIIEGLHQLEKSSAVRSKIQFSSRKKSSGTVWQTE